MKKIFLVLSIFVFVGLFCIGCKKTPDEVPQDAGGESQNTEAKTDQASEVSSEDLLIRPGIGVGKIDFGMTVQQMKDILGKPDVAATGISYMYTSLGIELVAKDKINIDAILCGNPSNKKEPMFKAMKEAFNLKTVEGIGIGSTEAQVIKAFGQPTRRSDDNLRYKDMRISFTLDEGKVIGIWVSK